MGPPEGQIAHHGDTQAVQHSVLSAKRQLTPTPQIQALPLDILAHIVLGFVYDPAQNSHIILSHTCRVFRSVVLSLPMLWSTLTSKMRVVEVKARLERSRDVGLTIKLLEPHAQAIGRWWVFLNMIKRVCHRWKSFIFDLGYFHATGQFCHKLCAELANMCLPRLVHLELLFRRESVWMKIEKDTALRVPYFNHTWSTPRLQTVVYMPIDSDGEAMFQSIAMSQVTLTRLDLTLEQHYRSFIIYPIRVILGFLSGTMSLQALRLKIFIDLTSDNHESLVYLGSLRSLDVTSGNYTLVESKTSFRRLLSLLQVPNLTSYRFSIMVAVPYRHIDIDQFQTFFTDNVVQVRNLTIGGLTRKDDVYSTMHGGSFMELLFKTFTRLQSLTLEYLDLSNVMTVVDGLHVPPLQTVFFNSTLR